MQSRSYAAIIIAQKIAHLFSGAEVFHLHGDAVLRVLHRRNCMDVVIYVYLVHHRKVEVHRFRLRARYDLSIHYL